MGISQKYEEKYFISFLSKILSSWLFYMPLHIERTKIGGSEYRHYLSGE